MANSALEGIRVIEFGRFIAAPYCAQLLADAGADVIKVEPLSGDDARRNGTKITATEARQYLNKNRNKRSVACDLSNPEVISALVTLASDADVIIANFRPGQAEKLGLDYSTLSQTNPRLIYAENSGFGLKGPLAGAAGMDLALQGYSGLAMLTNDGPQAISDPIIDYTAALLMAWGVSTALFHRERTGEGQKLDVSLLQAALVLQNNSLNHIDLVDSHRQNLSESLKQSFAAGASWQEISEQLKTYSALGLLDAYYGFFKTADGVICIGAGSRAVQIKLIEALDISDPALSDPTFEPIDLKAHIQQQKASVLQVLATDTAISWLAKLVEAGVPSSLVQLKPQVMEDEQIWANDYLSRVTHPEIGEITIVSPPVKFSKTSLSIRTPSPALGQHSTEILLEAGLDRAQVETLLASGAIISRTSSDQSK